MDRIDDRIVNILRRDASISNVRLAERVGLAPSSCLRRVTALRKSGIIGRVVALPNAEKMGIGLKAIVTIKLKNHDIRSIHQTTDLFDKESSVSQVYSITGDFDLLVILSATTMSGFQKIMHSILEETQNIEQYFTQFVVEEHKYEPGL